MKETSFYKIIHTTCHREWGGLEKRIFNEAVWMKEHGHELAFVLPENTPLFDRLKSQGFRVYPMKFGRMRIFSNYKRLIQIFKTEMPDIVNTHGNADTKVALLAAKKAGVPCRILSRHISAHVRNSWYNRMLYKKLSDYVFTTAEYTRQHLQKVFKIRDIEIFSIPSGIRQPKELMDRDAARLLLAKELGADQDTRYIGFAGRICRDKDLSTLIQAFGKLGSHIDHHLVIVGDGDPSYLESLKKEVGKLGQGRKVHFPGFREDVWPVFRALDCVVLPSRKEGVPQMIIEAMYSQCPVIAARTGGIVDIVEHERTGLLFEVGDVHELARQILFTLDKKDLALERVARASQLVKEKHTLDVMGRNIIRIYSLHQVRRRRDGLVQASKIPESWEL